MTNQNAAPLLEVRHLRKHFLIRKGFVRKTVGTVRAVDDVSFSVNEGETLGLVGESGCGKTTTARCILRAMAPTSGQMLFRTSDGRTVDLAGLGRRELRPLRPQMQMIFQDPYGSLNPRMTLADIVGEPLLVNGMTGRRERTERVAELLRLVGLPPEYTPSPADSGSGSASRAPSLSTRGSSWPTSRCRRWTSPCRRRSSTCCWTCRNGSS
jgi:peptide/nickel transport system ATP-binding protein